MKRFTLSILMLCFTIMMMAEPVGKHAALYTAKSFMLSKGKTVQSTQPSFKSSRKGATHAADDAYYYVFDAGNDNGYVIVSGDDRTEPILGYVDQGSFDPDNIPENMRSWLQLYADQIKYIVDNNIQSDDPRIKKRNKVAGTRHSVGEILTTRWNQGKPYNITCPDYYLEDDKEEATALPLKSGPATGCTATAMAQVMNFYKYPAETKKIIPAYSITYTSKKNNSQKTTNIPAIAAKTVIDWENMRDTYSWPDGHVANRQDSAVANLMRYCGHAVKMHYGPSSGANFSAEAYINYFGYDKGAYVGERQNYSIDEWFNMLYNEIEQGYPVLFSGFSSGGGHAFVLDGFDGENLFHLNWGWGGGSNGWFLVGILNPGDNSGIGASSSSDGYSMSQRALFNLRVPGTPKGELSLEISDVSVSSTSITAKFTNKTGVATSFQTAIVMMQEDGTYSVVGSRSSIANMLDGSTVSKTFTIKNKLTEGSYKLSPAKGRNTESDEEIYRRVGRAIEEAEWIPKYDLGDLRSQYIEAVVDSANNFHMAFHHPTVESISIDTIVFPGSQVMKEQQEIKVTFRNNGKEYYRVIYLHASQTQKKVYTKSKSVVAVRSGETVDVSYFFKPDTTGIYNLWFCTGEDGSGVIGEGKMEVITEAQADKANLTVNSYSITNSVNGTAYGNRLIGKAKIKNNKNVDFRGQVKLQVWTQYGGSGSAWPGTSKTTEVNIMAGQIADVDFEFNELERGNKYWINASYITQKGELGNGGVWDLGGWMMGSGMLLLKKDGSPVGKAHSSTVSVDTLTCAVVADCSSRISRMTPNSKNSNVIYAFAAGMALPRSLNGYNVVSGNHADQINLVNDKPYLVPTTINADNASFTYTFSETEDGTKWHAFTMPFMPDSIFLDDQLVSLEDTLNNFCIYEFSAERNEQVVFAPAKKLRGATPYLIAANKKMAGRSLVFRAANVSFSKMGTDKMIVSSTDYRFHGNTYSPKVQDCYIMNDAGTAFEYTSASTALKAMTPYFTTNLPDSQAPASIMLPDIPLPIVKELTLDEMATVPVAAGTYDLITLKHTFETGYNTICLPFTVENVEEIFGVDARAYELYSFEDNKLNFLKTDVLVAGQPYVIIVPNAITEDIILSDISIDETSTQAGFITRNGAHLRGTYKLSNADMFSMELHRIDADGSLVKLGPDELIYGYRAVLYIPTDEEVTICLHDDATGIASPLCETETGAIYNIAGQRLSKMQKGINIVKNRKVLR